MEAIILAAGESSRFWPFNSRHKSLFKIMGKPIIWYTIKGLKEAGIEKVIVVQSKKKDVENELKNFKFNLKLKFAIQKEPLGTGDALLKAKNLIEGKNFFVLNAERFDAKDFIPKMIELKKIKKAGIVLLSSKTKTPWEFGILKMKGQKILDIVEKPKKPPSNLKITGLYLLEKNFLKTLQKVPKGPYSLIEAFLIYAKKERAFAFNFQRDLPTLKYPWDLFLIFEEISRRFLKEKISKSAKISKKVKIKGKVFLDENCKIMENTIIDGNCYFGKNCVIKRGAKIFGFSNFEDMVVVGENVKIKNSIAQANSRIFSSFLGYSIIGENCFLGKEVKTITKKRNEKEIFCFTKGKKVNTFLKNFGCAIGNKTKIGSFCKINPGILIGENLKIPPKKIIKENLY